jgi:phage anti-repressor protein
MELIKISINSEGQTVVSARDLYAFLGHDKSQWARWYSKNIINNKFAIENEDWTGFDLMSNGNSTKDFALILNFAKKLCMLARTERGEQARQYFIDCETKLKAVQASANFLPEELMTTINELIDDKIQHLATKQELKKLDQQTDKLVTDVIGSFYDWLNDNVFQAIEERLNKLEGKFQNLSIEKLKELVLCYVYFLREGDSDNFKIGISIGTKIRIQNLSVGNSQKLTAVWQIPFKSTDAAKACEDFLKVFFFEKKIRGEWFKLEYQDFEFIQQLTEIHTTHLENTLG